jgi:hypothetical protein
MSPASDSSLPYKVVYSERVRSSLRSLVLRAKTRRLDRQILEAAKEMDRRLRVYPQFGEPLYELKTRKGTVWIGVVSPLVCTYLIDEDIRTVFVVVAMKALQSFGL